MQRWAVESESGQGGWWVFELLLKTRFKLKTPRFKWRGMDGVGGRWAGSHGRSIISNLYCTVIMQGLN